MDLREAHRGGEVCVFPERFVEAGPPRLAAHVEDGRKIPGDAARPHIACGDRAHLLSQRYVPGRRQSLVLREEDRLLRVVGAMHRVDAVNDGDAQARLRGFRLNGRNDLAPVVQRKRGVDHVQDGADVVVADDAPQLLGYDGLGERVAVGHHPQLQLRHLAHFLFQRHQCQERIDVNVEVVDPAARAVRHDPVDERLAGDAAGGYRRGAHVNQRHGAVQRHCRAFFSGALPRLTHFIGRHRFGRFGVRCCACRGLCLRASGYGGD